MKYFLLLVNFILLYFLISLIFFSYGILAKLILVGGTSLALFFWQFINYEEGIQEDFLGNKFDYEKARRLNLNKWRNE